jgi:hypothetical protein
MSEHEQGDDTRAGEGRRKEERGRAPWLGETARWLVVTLLIPFAGFVWNEVQKREAERLQTLEEVKIAEQRVSDQRRADSELIVKLLPALTGDPDSPARSVALAVLSDLAHAGVMGDGMVIAVQTALEDSERRLRAGTATPAERRTLTRIAVNQDRNALAVESAAPQQSTPNAAAVESTAIASRNLGLEKARADIVAQTARPRTDGLTASSARRVTGVVAVPRVYVQIFDEADRAAAERLRGWAQDDKNWLAPGVENVTKTATLRGTRIPRGLDHARVVYFNDGDKERADEVAAWLRKVVSTAVEVVRSTVPAPAGQLEVWYPMRQA